MDFELLRHIREYEMAQVLPLMTPGQTVLEIGAGAGWQSQMMADYGMHVISVDLATTFYREVQSGFLVVAYDGFHLPIKSHSVDVIFSSNVLEHIAHLDVIQAELHRVLKPDGKAIHILPTSSWRLWTSLVHPLNYVISRFQRDNAPAFDAASEPAATPVPAKKPSLLTKVRNVLFAPRHGEIGTMPGELYYFSQIRWRRHFEQTGWEIEASFPNGLFYTGYTLFSETVTMERRQQLNRILGSSCRIYVLRTKTPR